jgi:3-hydroxymyristoyl/3-hydroxydecanoyl-(acyl carrier protein) dehydratase
VPGRDPLLNAGGFFPGTLLVELMAQTAGLLLPGDNAGAFVAGLRDVAFHDAAREGESLEVRAVLDRSMGPLFIFDCRAETSGRILATGSITLRAF